MRPAACVLAAALLLSSESIGKAGVAGRAGAAGAAGQVQAATVRIGVQRGSSYDVVTVPLEEYVARVLTGEALPGSAPAAMEALAIAVRTYTEQNLGRHRAEGFDLCDQTHCQVMRTATATTTRAAEATKGQVLLYRGVPATIYYSASCGGRTEVPSAVWPGAVDFPYLPSQPDDGCRGLPVWTTELALSDLRRSFAAAGYRGTLRDMSVTSRDESGRVALLKLDGLTPDRVSGQDLRMVVAQTLGSQYVRSAAFDMKRTGDSFRLDGRGSGHGVGMCVIGSANLAAAGQSATTILAHYYPGLVLGRFSPGTPGEPGAPALTSSGPRPSAPIPALPSTLGRPNSSGTVARQPIPPAGAAPPVSGVAVTLPEEDEGERDALVSLAARERDELAATLGVPVPRLTLHVHATSADYERVTGRPWFTTGAIVNNEIHLPPLAPLRDRGVLERMLRRQIVHVLVDGPLGKRPAWVKEGAALYYADGQAGASENVGRVVCPADLDLQRPVSAGSLSVAFAEARACFERQIGAGRSWRDVR